MPVMLAYLNAPELIALFVVISVLVGVERIPTLAQNMNQGFLQLRKVFNDNPEEVQALSHLFRFLVIVGIVAVLSVALARNLSIN